MESTIQLASSSDNRRQKLKLSMYDMPFIIVAPFFPAVFMDPEQREMSISLSFILQSIAAAIVLALVISWRYCRTSARLEGSVLVVRNPWRTHSFELSEFRPEWIWVEGLFPVVRIINLKKVNTKIVALLPEQAVLLTDAIRRVQAG